MIVSTLICVSDNLGFNSPGCEDPQFEVFQVFDADKILTDMVPIFFLDAGLRVHASREAGSRRGCRIICVFGPHHLRPTILASDEVDQIAGEALENALERIRIALTSFSLTQ